MSKPRFCLVGDGAIAQYHKRAIEHVGGELSDIHIIDPKYMAKSYVRDMGLLYSKGGMNFDNYSTLLTREAICREMVGDNLIKQWSVLEDRFDYVVICSNSHLHREQIKTILNIAPKTQIICEKPAFMPWEPPICDDRINIVLQLRYLPGLPEKADLVKAVFVRDEEYFKTWKGDARKTGGLFFSLFIHYIDLAIQLGADFEGMVKVEGEQEKLIVTEKAPEKQWDIDRKIDILKIDYQTCYNRMYEDIVSGGGIKPKEIFYLNWILHRNSEIFGYGRNGMNKLIRIGKELL